MNDPKQELIDAAGPLFAEKGFDSTTVREISDRAQANQAAINYHFRDKKQLYIACVRQASQSCMDRAPIPLDLASLPPEAALKTFVHRFLQRVAVDHEPAWHAQLLMREMQWPTEACHEFVEVHVKPTFNILKQILEKLLPPSMSEQKKMLIGFSIVGQILHYRSARPVVHMLVGKQLFAAFDVDTLTEHITQFSLAAVHSLNHTC